MSPILPFCHWSLKSFRWGDNFGKHLVQLQVLWRVIRRNVSNITRYQEGTLRSERSQVLPPSDSSRKLLIGKAQSQQRTDIYGTFWQPLWPSVGFICIMGMMITKTAPNSRALLRKCSPSPEICMSTAKSHQSSANFLMHHLPEDRTQGSAPLLDLSRWFWLLT